MEVQDSNRRNVEDGGWETSYKVVVAKISKVQRFELIKAITNRASELVIVDEENACGKKKRMQQNVSTPLLVRRHNQIQLQADTYQDRSSWSTTREASPKKSSG